MPAGWRALSGSLVVGCFAWMHSLGLLATGPEAIADAQQRSALVTALTAPAAVRTAAAATGVMGVSLARTEALSVY